MHGGKEKMFRGGATSLIPGKSLPAPWYRREFGGSGLPSLLVPLPLPRSTQGAAAKKGDRGIPDLPFPRNPRRGIRLSGLLPKSLTAKRSFLLDRARPVFFSARAKRKWGVHSLRRIGAITDSFGRSSTGRPSAGACHRRCGCGSSGRSPGRCRRWPPRSWSDRGTPPGCGR